MNIKLIIFFLLCTCISLTAQVDDTKKTFNFKYDDSSSVSKAIFSVKLTPFKGITTTNNRPYLYNTPLTDYFKKTSGVDITAKSNLIKPTWEIKQKFSEGQKNVSKFARDHYLGEIKTTSKYIRIKCRDHEYVDGDRIRLFLNKAIIHPNITLTGSFYIIDVELSEGLNTLEFEALNEGLSSPNTAELKIYDENDVLLSSNRWFITTGYKARLVIMKQ
ncbi:hypothetical protein EB822_07965 [Flavobacteriaceae bacterium PRS1]|nr:hypothetical protein EB822_07965 [Flavobacteriaceae bacterium PRS1]